MGCNMCVVQKPEEQYKVMLQVNGKELSKLSQEQTLEALRSSKEPLVIQVLRRSPRLRGDSSCHDLQLVDSGTQTDITFEHIMALGKLRPPTPPMVILEPYVLSELAKAGASWDLAAGRLRSSAPPPPSSLFCRPIVFCLTSITP